MSKGGRRWCRSKQRDPLTAEPANEPPQISQERRWRTARLAGVEVLYGAIAAALGGVFISVFADRYPVATRAFVWFGVLLITVSLAWFALLSLWAPVIVVALVMLLNWGVAVSHTTSADRAKPGTGWALGVWQEEAESLRSLGWIHRGTWILDVGRVTPAFTVFERPGDRTRVGMMGTAPYGGVISIDTLLDEGRGVLITLRNRSSLLRPPWMLRQELARPLSELIAAHDEALFLLEANGITAGGTVPGDALEFEKYSNRKLRRHMFRRWWLWALRPIVIRLARSTRRPLFEQIHTARQITRYGKAIDREPPLVTRPTTEGRPGRKDD
jgi:hypothetical protein